MLLPAVSMSLSDCFNEFIQRRWHNSLQSAPGVLHCTEMLGWMSGESELYQ
jgi:hypothetical protein